MGRQFLTSDLLSDLCIGTTLAFLRQEGDFPLISAALWSLAKIVDIRSATNLNARKGIPFNFELFISKESIHFLTCSESVSKYKKSIWDSLCEL